MKRWSSFFYSPFFITTFLLAIKYYGIQLIVFQNANPLNWLVTALPSVLIFTIPLELALRNKPNKRNAYLLLNALVSTIFLAVVIYFRQFGIIVTYHALMQANQVMDVNESILHLIQPLYVLYYLDLLIYFALKLFRVKFPKLSDHRPNARAMTAVLAAVLAVLIVNSIQYSNVLNELKKAERMGVIGFQLHTLISEIESARAASPSAPITPNAVRAVKNIELLEEPEGFGAAEGRNVIMIQLESIQNFLIDLSVDGQEITPTLNGLKEHSYYFSNIYQTISQGNTSDAEFVANTGFYPPAQQAASQMYADKAIPSLPRLLNKRGYHTITLHTNEVDFWNRIQLYPALGFTRYYDQKYFGNEDIIAFGPSDEVLYEKTMPILKRLQFRDKRFYAHIIAQSSHHPFDPPKHKELISLPEEWEGTFIGNYLKMANYADRALGEFIEQLKVSGLWEQSIIVIYGDHFGVSPHQMTEEEHALLQDVLGHEYDQRTVHNVPLLIAIPGVTDEGETLIHTGGQVDIMATVANLLGISLENHVQFGQDLLNYRDNIVASRYYLPTGSFYNNEIMYISGETFDEGTLIPLTKNEPEADLDPTAYYEDFSRIMRLLEMNDAYLESLPLRR